MLKTVLSLPIKVTSRKVRKSRSFIKQSSVSIGTIASTTTHETHVMLGSRRSGDTGAAVFAIPAMRYLRETPAPAPDLWNIQRNVVSKDFPNIMGAMAAVGDALLSR